MFVPTLLATSQYFEKKRALALGITSAGGGIGSFYMPALVRVLFDNYPFQHALVYKCCVVVQVIVLAAFIRPQAYW